MKLSGSAIHVNDLNQSIDFYENILNLKLDIKVDAGEFDIAFLNSDSFRIELLAAKDKKEVTHTENVIFRFDVDSLDETIKELNSKGISVHSGPFKPAPNVQFFFIKDPNGVLIQFAEQLDTTK